METNRSVLEESIFGQTGANNEVATTRFDKPPGWTGNSSAKVSRTGTGRNIGPNTLQKVMAGDMINATAQYYHQGTAGGNSSTMVNTVLTSLVQAITGSGGTGALVKGNTGNINTQLSGAAGFINAVQPNGANPASTIPQAFLTAIFFDERFNMIPAADGGVVQLQVAATVGSNGGNLVLNPTNYKAPKNGYVYIYLSNQSNDYVYWDNFQVGITQGNIAEENHYYAYGLKIATLSSKKLGDVYQGSLKNSYLYQGAFSELDEDIGWHDFMLRNYDAQIGRWVQQDPYQQFASPYVGMGNDPINNIDPSGGYSFGPFVSSVMNRALWAVGGAMIGGAIDAASGGNGINGALIGGAVGLGASFVNWGAAGVVLKKIAIRIGLQSASVAVNIINNGVVTQQVGKQATMVHGPNVGDVNNTDALKDEWEGGYNIATGKWDDITWNGETYKALSKSDIERILGSTGSIAENRYEGIALKAFGQKRNKISTATGEVADGRTSAALATIGLNKGVKLTNVEHDLYEIKLLGENRNLGGDAQMQSFVLDIAASKAGRQGIGSLWIITTANNAVSDDLRIGATNAKVNLFHSVAYADPDNPRIIRFAQWRGVSITMGSMMYNRLYGKNGYGSIGPFAGLFIIP
jgi:RHS repeat-associated protein